jgi:AcrR family transcriptional regulator
VSSGGSLGTDPMHVAYSASKAVVSQLTRHVATTTARTAFAYSPDWREAVGVSPSAIYRHVPSIDALLAEVSQMAREHLAARMVEQREHVPKHRTRKIRAWARFRALGRAYVDFALTEPQLFDTAFVPTSLTPQRPDDPSAWQVLVDGVQELVDAGALREAAATDAVLVAWSGVHGIASILRRALLVNSVTDNHEIDVVRARKRQALDRDDLSALLSSRFLRFEVDHILSHVIGLAGVAHEIQ